jgi:hypothetical protein
MVYRTASTGCKEDLWCVRQLRGPHLGAHLSMGRKHGRSIEALLARWPDAGIEVRESK